jgi:hypothetical protein
MHKLSSTADPKVTLVVVARERFSFARESLESLYESERLSSGIVDEEKKI